MKLTVERSSYGQSVIASQTSLGSMYSLTSSSIMSSTYSYNSYIALAAIKIIIRGHVKKWHS